MPRFVLACLFGLALATAARAQNVPSRIVVKLPADATLYVEDVRFPQSGVVRTIETAALEPGSEYTYTLKAEAERGGKPVVVTKTVVFKPGETKTLDLNPHFPAPAVAKGDAKLSKEEQEVLDLVNAERQKVGSGPIRASAILMRAAREHSANMAAQDQLGHDLDGKGPGDRLQALGYQSFGWGENVAAGQRTPQEVVESWMNSPGHRGNILNDNFREIGIGVATSAGGGRYWTQVFGTPAQR